MKKSCYLVLVAIAKIMLSDAMILEIVLGFYQRGNGNGTNGILSTIASFLGFTSPHTAAVPLFQMSGAPWTGRLAMLVWSTAAVAGPIPLLTGFALVSTAWARRMNESEAREVASQLKKSKR